MRGSLTYAELAESEPESESKSESESTDAAEADVTRWTTYRTADAANGKTDRNSAADAATATVTGHPVLPMWMIRSHKQILS